MDFGRNGKESHTNFIIFLDDDDGGMSMSEETSLITSAHNVDVETAVLLKKNEAIVPENDYTDEGEHKMNMLSHFCEIFVAASAIMRDFCVFQTMSSSFLVIMFSIILLWRMTLMMIRRGGREKNVELFNDPWIVTIIRFGGSIMILLWDVAFYLQASPADVEACRLRLGIEEAMIVAFITVKLASL